MLICEYDFQSLLLSLETALGKKKKNTHLGCSEVQHVLALSFQHQFGVQQPCRTEIVSLQVLNLKDCEASCIQAL